MRSGDYEMMDLLYDDIPDTLSQLIRTAFVPQDGKKFIVADFSAIEARVLSWLAREKWRMEVFAKNGDIYCETASRMFGVPVEKHGINGHLRQKGKQAELSCGYGGSVGALKAMGALAMGMQEEELQPLVDSWRAANLHIVDFWWEVDRAVKMVVKQRIPVEVCGIKMYWKSGFLFIVLPSGRKLAYVKPRMGENKFGGESVTYEGVAGTKKWERLESYGPKFVENIVQAISRDVLVYAMQTLRNCSIVAHVHDEIIIEADRRMSLDAVCEQMGSQGISQELTDRQLAEVETELKKAMDVMVKNGAMALLATLGPKKAAESFNKEQARSYERYTQAVEYKKYVIKRRDTKNITATLKEARPMLEISQQLLDADEFFLNTPDATYDLRKGGAEAIAHDPLHFITKQTGVAPGTEGKELWESALDTFFQSDKDLIEYVQKIVGLASVGKVYVEALIIAYGEGRNGKSTFWNVVSRVLGSYSGNISADMLTVGCRRNVKPELAEAKGKRLLIAAELEEGMRLNTSNVKQLCSTDEIYAEKKYKDPFSYTPTHTLVLYTNHLPKVGAIDKGTWRRLIVIPFNAKIEGNSDIKNYADYLYENAGVAILSWIMEGAKKVIAEQFHIEAPEKVKEAIAAYRDNNDWMQHFLDECCEIDESYTAKSGEVYNEYRAFCIRVGEFIRSTADFYTALDGEEFTRKRTNKGVIVKGLRLKSEFSD